MAREQYRAEKRRKEIARQKKQEEKRLRRQERKRAKEESEGRAAEGIDQIRDPSMDPQTGEAQREPHQDTESEPQTQG
jgi:hypothetical protein